MLWVWSQNRCLVVASEHTPHYEKTPPPSGILGEWGESDPLGPLGLSSLAVTASPYLRSLGPSSSSRSGRRIWSMGREGSPLDGRGLGAGGAGVRSAPR